MYGEYVRRIQQYSAQFSIIITHLSPYMIYNRRCVILRIFQKPLSTTLVFFFYTNGNFSSWFFHLLSKVPDENTGENTSQVAPWQGFMSAIADQTAPICSIFVFYLFLYVYYFLRNTTIGLYLSRSLQCFTLNWKTKTYWKLVTFGFSFLLILFPPHLFQYYLYMCFSFLASMWHEIPFLQWRTYFC